MKHTKNVLFILLITTAFLLEPRTLQAQTAGSATNSPIDSFKAFMESPPVIETLAFQHRTIEPEGKTNGWQNYLVRFQDNGLIIKQVPSFETNDLGSSPMGRFYINYENKYLYLDASKNFRFWVDDNKMPRNKDNESFMAYGRAKLFLGKSLNLGITDVEPGRITWSGDSFDAGKNLHGVHIFGAITAKDKDGLPSYIDTTYDLNGKSYSYRIKYDYAPNAELPRYLPSSLQFGALEGAEFKLKEETRFLALKLASHPLDESFFSMKEYLKGTNHLVLLHTNNGLFYRLPKVPGLISVDTVDHKFAKRRNLTWILFIVVDACIIIALAWIFLQRRKSKQNN